MSASPRPFATLLAAAGLLLAPATGNGESALAGHMPASAALDFRIIIPPVMRVLENSHPRQLDTSNDGVASAEQRLVVMSNMKRGFCVSLRRAAHQRGTWDMQTAPQSDVQFSALADGYRLCGTRPGQYTLVLQHRFATSDRSSNALHWPVLTDISAI